MPSYTRARQAGPGLDQSPPDAGSPLMHALKHLHALAVMAVTPWDLHTQDLLGWKQGGGCIQAKLDAGEP